MDIEKVQVILRKRFDLDYPVYPPWRLVRRDTKCAGGSLKDGGGDLNLESQSPWDGLLGLHSIGI